MKKKIIFYIGLFIIAIHMIGVSQSGDLLFDDTFIHTIEINSIDPYNYEEFHDTLFTSHDRSVMYGLQESGTKPYYPASVTMDGLLLDSVGVRYKGISTFELADEKFSLKLDFNEYVGGQNIDGIKKVNLHSHIFNPTCMRLKLAYEVMDRMGVPAPRVTYAKVYLNGSYRGLYSMVEQIDKTFVKDHFDPNQVGYLHKAWGLSIGFETEFTSGQDTSFEHLNYWAPLKTKKSENNYQPLVDFIRETNIISDSNFKREFGAIFNIQGFIDQTAATLIMDDSDHYCVGNWNFYLYLDPANNKWNMIPWDYNLAFSIQPFISNPLEYQGFGDPICLLTNRTIVDNDELKQDFHESLCNILNVGMDSTWINNRIDELADLLRDDLADDPYHFCPGEDFELYLDQMYEVPVGEHLEGFQVPALRTFVNNRYSVVRQQLADVGSTCLDDGITAVNNISESRMVTIVPSLTSDYITLKTNENFKQMYIYNAMGKLCKIQTVSDQMNVQDLSKGLYFVRMVTSDQRIGYIGKFIKL